jgi:uncharacterized Tic20 family protein
MFFPGNPIVTNFFMHLPIYMLSWVALCVVVFGVFPAINAIRVYNGKEPWRYLLKINFFK